MKITFYSLFILLILSCAKKQVKYNMYAKDNLIAWCFIPPFDNQPRTTEDRIAMLKKLGFKKYVQDWRRENLPQLADDIKAYRENGIELVAVWFWIDGSDEGLFMDENTKTIIYTMRANNIKSDLWFTFNNHYFRDLSDPDKLARAVKSVAELREIAAGLGGKIAMYNHMGWFGEPENQVKIINELAVDDIGIVYNFHHAHQQIKDFRRNLDLMLPYLWTVNLNGMNPDGPKILPLGQGSKEPEMMQILKDSGFKGTVGIIGHREDVDVLPVLEENLAGLEELRNKLR